jgi:DNA replication protein DnaC
MYSKSLFYDTGVPQRHRLLEADDNKCELWQKSYDQLKTMYDNKGLIGVTGNRGSGKTQASAIIIAMNSSKKKRGIYTKVHEIFLSIRDSQTSGRSLMSTFDSYVKPHLLVIDAFQVRSETEFEFRTLISILDKRYDEMKPTIIISNDSPQALLESIGDDGRSRMKEGGGIVQFTSTDFRGTK